MQTADAQADSQFFDGRTDHFVGFVARRLIFKENQKVKCVSIRLEENVGDTKFEQPHNKTKMTCAPSKHSDQPGHPPSLIRVFAVGMKKPLVFTFLLSAQ